MGTGKAGILPHHEIEELIKSGGIKSKDLPNSDQIQPASIDLRLGETAWRVRASFLPNNGKSVSEKLDEISTHKIDLKTEKVLETGCVYIVELQESLELPEDLSATTNPKSSTGRLDIFTRVIANHGCAFDAIPVGYSGRLFAEISPKSFPILVRSGSKLSQIRFRRGNARIEDEELSKLHKEESLVNGDAAHINGGVNVSIDLVGSDPGGIIGYRAKHHSALIDVDKKQYYDPMDFWEPIRRSEKNYLILDPDEFYILVSKESVNIPPDYAAEMLPFDPLIGEFRVHYAGFFDPGFGYSKSGGCGSRAVLEVRSHDVPFILEHGQTVGRLIYERMTERPKMVYGQQIGSNYQGQNLKLSKHFSPMKDLFH